MSTIVSRGFVLVEIIISVMLLSFAGIALLKVNSNQKKLYSIAQNKLEDSRQISIIINRHSIEMHKKNLNLYDVVKKNYKIKNDKLKKILKNSNIKYEQNYKSMIKIETGDGKQPLAFLIDEIKVSSKKGTSRFITVKK